MRFLQADRFRNWGPGLLAAAIFMGAWAAWMFLARVTLYQVSRSARLEVHQAAHPLEAPVEGRIVAVHTMLGQEVEEGQPLFQLDARRLRLELEEQRIRLVGLRKRIDWLAQEEAAVLQALHEQRRAAGAAVEQAKASAREARVVADSAQEKYERISSISAKGLLAEADVAQARSEAERSRAAAQSLHLAVSRLRQERQAAISDRMAQLKGIEGQAVELHGLAAAAEAAIRRLEHDIEERKVRAPSSGRLSSLSERLRIGAFVNRGERLAVVVPFGVVRAVADFDPSALGRIQPGQPARLRLKGFHWTQYGSLAARVTSLDQETRHDVIRVELTLESNVPSTIPIQHGLPASAEVEVGARSPAYLLLQAAGGLAGAQESTPSTSLQGEVRP